MTLRALFSSLLSLGLAAETLAQTPVQTVDALRIPDWFSELRLGSAIDGLGDVDGDGHDDYVVGIPGFRLEVDQIEPWGAARVVSGRTGLAIHTVYGATDQYDEFGAAVAGLGDLSGDGIPDFAVGAPHTFVGGSYAGRVFIFSGSDGAFIRFFSGHPGDYLGWSLKGVGDVDGDGLGDLMVGAPALGGGTARVDLVSGTGAHLQSWTLGTTHFLGMSFGVGNFDGDSTPDVYLGAPARDPQGVGAVMIYEDLGARVIGFSFGGRDYGRSLAMLGDLDADGVDDYAAGEPGGLDPSGAAVGRVAVVSADRGDVLHEVFGSRVDSFYAQALAAVGDQDGDGAIDYVVGERHHNSSGGARVGRVVLYSSDGGEVLHHSYGRRADCWFGAAVAAVGDVNGDGRPDYAAGSPYDVYGSVRVFGTEELRMDFFRGFVQSGDRFDLSVRNGRPLAPFLLFLHSVDGLPFSRLLLRRGLNGAGEATVSFQSGTDGDHEITMFVLSLDANSKVVSSNLEVLHTED